VACPYGVNYFNWKDPEENSYLDWEDSEVVQITGGGLPYGNPDLKDAYGSERRRTAGGGRHKGVVEKCTFCVHRLEKGKGTACEQVCPTQAIHFGDLDDPNSELSQILRKRDAFRLLEDAGTQPRVYYVGGHPPTTESRQIEEVKVRV
jgi:molybdopterin-containing oxidoreductase family iron-sulfur binding subunit